MIDIVKDFLNTKVIRNIPGIAAPYTAEKKIIYVSPLYGSSKSFLINGLSLKESRLVVLLPDSKSVDELKVELTVLGLADMLLVVNEFRPEPLQETLTEISKREKFILISTYSILNCELPSKEKINEKTTRLQVGGNLSYDDVTEYLSLLNYQKDKFVEAPGDYSQRGAIIDFWSYSEHNPVRLEFDGDFLESIRYFDPESQRSIEQIKEVTLAPSLSSGEDQQRYTDIFTHLDKPLIIASSFELKNFKPEKFNCFAEVKPVIAADKPEGEPDEKTYLDDFPEGQEETETAPDAANHSEDYKKYLDIPGAKWLIEEELGSTDNRIDAGISDSPSINSNYEILFNTLKDYAEKSYRIIITSENELQTAKLRDLLSEFKKELAVLIDSGKVRIETLAIKKGFLLKEEKLLILTDYEIFNKPYRTKIPSSRKYKKSKSKAFASIKRGDYVVHEDYGIGRYAGLETIRIGEADQESMKLQFAEGGIVYVNLNYLTLVKKYSSNDNLSPTLSTLGTSDWVNTKSKTKKKIKEAARELIELYAKRKATQGYSFGSDTVWQKELEASFLYEDTPDQEKVTEEVKSDMEAENPMDRLVCGDVGFGKTEVAVRAAFKAVQDGKQAAVLVPTTILAEQHYNTFKDRLTQFPVSVEVMSRFQSKKKQTEISGNLKEGKVDVVIGTHRLLSKDIAFKDLGLLIIDEEHRFGVKAKEKLRSYKVNVDTLTLTATPIPRTLNLSLLGARDLSIIATPPPNRQPIYTRVAVFDIHKIKEWVMNEMRRNGQVYFVHDRVQSIEKLAGYIHKYIPDIRIAIAHGQMKASQLENVIHGFLNREYDVLLSTKIIESGIDIPNVNTIIVNRADRFGLAELHQLRGRVGRSSRQAYAYFIVPSLNGINKKALRRLQAIEEFTDVGAGFNISMRDLEIRGAGNLLGTEQTGFINEVGFDLYVKMINEAVEELKYQEFKEIFKSLPKQEERTEPTIDAYFDIGIPKEYMPEQMDRLNFYTSLYSIKEISELEELREEMEDRFGPLPVLIKRLIAAATLKLYSSYALFERVIIQRKNIFIILPKGEKEDYYKYRFVELMRFIMDNYKDRIKFTQQKAVLKFSIPNNFESPEKLLQFLINFSREVMDLFRQQKPEPSAENANDH
ncbi:MAG TPA: transcription-repair coupling factor [Ignavibacteriaceae bacterium]|nr:transcription-repair coupling factor [Ignavibacteriaceae bacterium]